MEIYKIFPDVGKEGRKRRSEEGEDGERDSRGARLLICSCQVYGEESQISIDVPNFLGSEAASFAPFSAA